MTEHGLTLREYAEKIGASIHTIRRAVREGRLAVVRVPAFPGSTEPRVYVPTGTEYHFLRPKREAARLERLKKVSPAAE